MCTIAWLIPRTQSKHPRSREASTTPWRDVGPDGDAYLQRTIAEQMHAGTKDVHPPSDAGEEILDNEDSFFGGSTWIACKGKRSGYHPVRWYSRKPRCRWHSTRQHCISEAEGSNSNVILLLQHNRRRRLSTSIWRISMTSPRGEHPTPSYVAYQAEEGCICLFGPRDSRKELYHK